MDELIGEKEAQEKVYDLMKKELESKKNEKIEEYNNIVISSVKNEFLVYLDKKDNDLCTVVKEVEISKKIIVDDIRKIKKEIEKLNNVALHSFSISNTN